LRPKRLPTSPYGSAPAAYLVAIDGSIQSDWCRRIQFEGLLRTSDGAWTLRGDADGLHWTPELMQQLPESPLRRCQIAHGLRGIVEAQFDLRRSRAAETIQYTIE
jgi:hypothetical protein